MGEFGAFFVGWNLLLEYVIVVAAVSKGVGLHLDKLLDNVIRLTLTDAVPIHWSILSEYFDFFGFLVPIVCGCKFVTTFL